MEPATYSIGVFRHAFHSCILHVLLGFFAKDIILAHPALYICSNTVVIHNPGKEIYENLGRNGVQGAFYSPEFSYLLFRSTAKNYRTEEIQPRRNSGKSVCQRFAVETAVNRRITEVAPGFSRIGGTIHNDLVMATMIPGTVLINSHH